MKVSDILKKYVLPNLPYLMFLWVSAKLGETVRLAPRRRRFYENAGALRGFLPCFRSLSPDCWD